jgi:DNA-directed RNA polymerase subunit beta'
LRGLKENVIIGRLIPAGTGFNAYEDSASSAIIDSDYGSPGMYGAYEGMMGSDEDMILDDRTARSYDLDDATLGGLSIIKPSSADEKDEFAGLYGDTVKAPATEEEDDFDWESPVGDSDDDDDFE